MKRPSVLVIRKKGRFSELLAEAGCPVVDLDLIKTEMLGDLTDLDRKIVKLDDYDGIFFTSPVAADIFAKRFREMNGRFGGKIYVLGKRARKILESLDFDV
ncbi:MAG: uroporphyrinogen-III synthase, partial [Pyrinomonadaceae bacterium]